MLDTLRVALLLLLANIILIGNLNAQPSESWKEYDDGKLFFKVSNSSSTTIGEYNRASGSVVELNERLHSLIDEYQIFSIKQAFDLPDKKLQKTFIIQFGNITQTETLINELRQFDFTEYVERVPLYRNFYTPDDIHPNQWHLQKINAPGAWDLSKGSTNVVVAVVDDEVRTDHEDLAANIWVNLNEIPNNGTDDDNNGYIDDVNGYDVADNDNDPNPPSVNPGAHSHGTHCAGIISAVTDNSTGIASIGFKIKIMGVKTQGANTPPPYLTNPYSGVSYAIAAKADVISMSWGGGSFSQTYQNLFNYAHNEGIVLVAAAGNSNTNIPHYPANYNHVISVAASNPSDQKASFSNYGTWVDVSSPGTGIFSTLSATTSSYGNMSGTSMACPLVSGLCGLMLSYAPFLSPDDIEACLKSGCDNIDALNPTYTGQLGAGRINARLALLCLQTSPLPDFTADYTETCPGQTVHFTDQTAGQTITSWSWLFLGGNPASSSLQNPTVTYSAPGFYAVTLSATNAFGTNDTTKTAYIHVTPPSAAMSGSTTIIQGTSAGLVVDFTGTPPWNITYTDGTTPISVNGITSNPHYISVSPTDTATYTLVSFSNSFCSGSISGSATINVVPPPQSLQCNYANIYGDANYNVAHEKFYDAVNDVLYIVGSSTVVGTPVVDLMKVNRMGDVIFAKSYNIAGSGSRLNTVKAPNGDLLVVGMHTADSFFILRVDDSGNVIWTKNYGSAGRERYPAIVQSIGDSYIISCWHTPTSSGLSDDVGIFKIDGSGNILWSKILDSEDDQIQRMVTNGNGGCLISGEVIGGGGPFGGGTRKIGFSEIDGNGNILWAKLITGNDANSSGGIVKTLDNGYAISGKTGAAFASMNDAFFIKLDSALNVAWLKGFSGLANNGNMPSQLIQDKHGNYYVPVCTTLAGISFKAAVMKYDVNGNFIWSKTLNYISEIDGSRFELVNTQSVPDDNIIIAGSSSAYPGGFGDNDLLLFSTDTSLNTCITQTMPAPTTVSLPFTLSNWTPTISNVTIVATNLSLNATNAPFSKHVICTNCNDRCEAFSSISASAYSVCTGDAVTFASDSVAEFYDWRINNISFSHAKDTAYTFNSPGTYVISLITVDSICTAIDSVIIIVNDLPQVQAESDTLLCLGNSVQLSASGGISYSWLPTAGLNSSNISNPVATPFVSTNYKVFVTDINGCRGVDSVFIQMETCCGSSADFTVSDTILCFGDTVTLQNQSATRGTPSFNWFFGATAVPLASSQVNPPPVKYTGSGVYEISLVLTDSCGTAVARQNVYVYNLPEASAGADTALCLSDTLYYQLGAPLVAYYTYRWSPPSNLSDIYSSEPIAALFTPVTYYMEVTDIVSGCKSLDTVTINAALIGASYITGLDSVYCANDNGGNIQGFPPGGTFIGEGIVGISFFNPKTADPGVHEIIYVHDCADTARAWVRIVETEVCDSLNFIAGIDEDEIQVYPNPFTNSILINVNSIALEELEIKLKDVLGREVLRASFSNQSQIEIEPIELTSGIYILEARTKKRSRIFKLIKASF